MDVPPAPTFADDAAYEQSLTDPGFWGPYARAALRISGLDDRGNVRMHVPTTHVAALVDEHYFVKLHFENWFGEDCFETEREAYRMLGGRGLPMPELLTEGALYADGWPWPFLVMTAMGGRSLRDVDGGPTTEDRGRVASWLGGVMRTLHGVPIEVGRRINHDGYCDLVRVRMQRAHRDHARWGSLPARFVPQIRDYLWAARELIDPEREPPVFLHGDVHDGNVFADGERGAIRPRGLVDFNDAHAGDPHYDLVSIHMKAFAADKALLRRFLDAYTWGNLGREWPRRMMALTLAHDFDLVHPLGARVPEDAETLDDLAALLWDFDAAALPPTTGAA